MSLLDAGPDVVNVFVEIDGEDAYGNPVKIPSDTPISVRGHAQPSTASESADLGQTTATVYRFISRTFPGGAFARIEWGGRDWDVIGEPKRHRRGHHVTTFMRARGV